MTERTREQVAALLDGATPGPLQYDPATEDVYLSGQGVIAEKVLPSDGLLFAAAPDLARQLLSAMDRLADADMAQAALVERAAEVVPHGWCQPETSNTVMDVELGMAIQNCIRRLAPGAGVKDLAALRARERESAMQALAAMGQAQEAYEAQLKAEADNSRLAAELAEARKQVEALREALEKVEAWGPFPRSGRFWHNGDGTVSDQEMSYSAAFGSNGERDFIRGIARAALTDKPDAGKGE